MPPKSQSTISSAAITRLGRVVVRAGGVRAGGDDGEVDLVVTLGEQPGRDVGGHLRLGAPDEGDLPAVQLGGDAIGGVAGGAQGGDLGVVLDRAQRADDVDGPPVRRPRQVRQQLDEEARPHLVADGDRRGRTAQPGDDLDGSADSGHGAIGEHVRLLDDPRRLQLGHDERRVAIARARPASSGAPTPSRSSR